MSVEDKNVIDIVSIDDNENVVLTISDHLIWDEENEHILILQDKINCYLGAIEEGELLIKYPNSRNRKIVIQVIALHHPNSDGREFLERVKEKLENFGYGFLFNQQNFGIEE